MQLRHGIPKEADQWAVIIFLEHFKLANQYINKGQKMNSAYPLSSAFLFFANSAMVLENHENKHSGRRVQKIPGLREKHFRAKR